MEVTSKAITPLIHKGETQIILQRHCQYNREEGRLEEESIRDEITITNEFMKKLAINSTPEELENTYIFFIASDTESNKGLKRAVSTVTIARETVQAFCNETDVPAIKVINEMPSARYEGMIKETKHLEEPRIFTDDRGFFEYLLEKHGGVNRSFWIDYEGDYEKAKRESFGSEGPDEIVNRGLDFLNYLQRYSEFFHNDFPDSRLIVWCGSHYDLISPLVKREILHVDKEEPVFVDYCGGLSFVINEENEMSVNLNGMVSQFDSLESKPPHRHF